MSEATLISVLARITAVEARCAALEAGGGARASSGAGGEIASDRDLDGQYGNPEVRKHPKQWKGPAGEFVGKKYSECSPEFLDVLADLKDWMAGKADEETDPEKKKYAKWNRLDAARARGWAVRIRKVGYRPAAPPPPAFGAAAVPATTTTTAEMFGDEGQDLSFP